MSMRINIHPQNPCDPSLHSLVKDVFKVCASWGTCDCTLFNRYWTSKGLFVSSKTIPVFKWKGGALVSITTVFMKHHILSAMLLTWVTWVYFPIPFSLFFFLGEEEGLVITCRKSGTLGIFPRACLCVPILVLIQNSWLSSQQKRLWYHLCMGQLSLPCLLFELTSSCILLVYPRHLHRIATSPRVGALFLFLWSLWLNEAQSLTGFPHYQTLLSTHKISYL